MVDQKWTLLVIDDNRDGQELVARILAHYSIDYELVATAEEGLERLEQQTYDAAIVDLALPSMDGWGFLRTLKSDPERAELPCIAITAYHAPEVAVAAIDAGFCAYFSKPLSAAALLRELERALRAA